jgi:hypothetical protein
MPDTSETEQLRTPAAPDPRLGVARMADMVCEATRQAALEGVAAVLALVADRPPELAGSVRDVADRALARATIMQTEIDRFRAVTRSRRCADFRRPGVDAAPANDTRMTRRRIAVGAVTIFIALEMQRPARRDR